MFECAFRDDETFSLQTLKDKPRPLPGTGILPDSGYQHSTGQVFGIFHTTHIKFLHTYKLMLRRHFLRIETKWQRVAIATAF